MKRLGKIIAIVCGALVLLVVLLQLVINMPFVSRKVSGAAADALGCELSFTRLNVSLIRGFPDVRVTVDSLSMELPGNEPIRVDRINLALNPWRLLRGKLRLLLDADAYSVRVRLEANGTLDRRKGNAGLDLALTAPGTSIAFVGGVRDFKGEDPLFDAHLNCLSELDSIICLVPMELGFDVNGDIDFKIDAKASKSELQTGRFSNGDVDGRLLSENLRFRMADDSLRASARNAGIRLKSNSEGVDVAADFDRIFFKKGGMSATRIGLKDVRIGAAVQKRVRHYRHRRPDSLARVEDDFSGSDIDISVDSTIVAYLRQWEPKGSIKAGRGFFSSPAIPLRTRLFAVDGHFTGNEVGIDTLLIKMGTSDVAAKGKVSGIRRALRKRGPIRADLVLESERLNLNELLVAFQRGEDVIDCDTLSEDEGSFVVDSIADADAGKEKLPLIIVPGNVDASLRIKADRVDYSNFLIGPFAADMKMKDRTLQLTDADAVTNFGGIHLDAFYSTKSKSDLSAGIGLNLRDISARDIINLLPGVDSMMPALKSFEGKLGLDLSATTGIDTNMNVIVPSLDGILRISGRDLNVSDVGRLKRITRLLLFRNKNIGQIQNLSVDAVVHDGKLEVFPFELTVDRYKLALRGMQGFDGRMNYHVSVMRSPFLIPFGINIYGYPDNWRFSLGFAKYRSGRVPVYTEQLDNMQFNIVKSIKDIYRRGVQNARRQSRKASESRGDDSSESDSPDERNLREFDEVSFNIAAATAEEELAAEVEEALSDNVIDLDELVREYEAGIMDKNIERRIEKLKK